MSGSIRNQRVYKSADFPKRPLTIALITALSQSGVVAFKTTPAYRFQVVRCRTYCLLKAGTVTGNLKVGSRTAAALTFTSATENAVTLSATLSNLRGSSTEAISVEYTTDGSGVLTNGFVIVWYRPWPLAGDLGPST